MFLWNIESYDDVEVPHDGFRPPLSSLYSVAAGFMPNRIHQSHGFDRDTRVVYFDYSPNALEVKQTLVHEWESDGFPHFVRYLFRKFPSPETFYRLWEGATPDTVTDSQLETAWSGELERWCAGQASCGEHRLRRCRLPCRRTRSVGQERLARHDAAAVAQCVDLSFPRPQPDGVPLMTDSVPRKFVILAVPRTGSNLLCTSLNSHPEILCYHEVFNPNGIFTAVTHRDRDLGLGTVCERDAAPLEFLQVQDLDCPLQAVSVKQNPTDLRDLVANYDDFSASIRREGLEEAPRVVAAIVESYKSFLDEAYRGRFDEVVRLVARASKVLEHDLRKLEDAYIAFRKQSPSVSQGLEEVDPLQERLAAIDQRRSELMLLRTQLVGQLAAIEKGKQEESGGEELIARIADVRRHFLRTKGRPESPTVSIRRGFN